jgi:hypothetical protein
LSLTAKFRRMKHDTRNHINPDRADPARRRVPAR